MSYNLFEEMQKVSLKYDRAKKSREREEQQEAERKAAKERDDRRKKIDEDKRILRSALGPELFENLEITAPDGNSTDKDLVLNWRGREFKIKSQDGKDIKIYEFNGSSNLFSNQPVDLCPNTDCEDFTEIEKFLLWLYLKDKQIPY